MIRRSLLLYLPQLAAMGFRPADIEDLWPAELDHLVWLIDQQDEAGG